MVQSFIISGNSTVTENITYVTVKDNLSNNSRDTIAGGISCNIANSVKHIVSLNMYDVSGSAAGAVWEQYFEIENAEVKAELDKPIGAFEYNDAIMALAAEDVRLNEGLIFPYDTSNIIIIRMPSSIETLGIDSFKNLSRLKTINIEQGIADINNIGDNVFLGCSSLENITINNNNLLKDNKVIDIFKGLNGASKAQFKYLTIGDNVRTIAADAFKDCSNLKIVSLSSLVENIKAAAFEDCESLITIQLEKSFNLKQIGANAFKNCNISSIKFILKSP